MNLNPFAVQAPETVESVLESANATCARFNSGKGIFVGQYLALGRTDGIVAICSVETRDVLRWLEGHVKSITSVSWSPYNRYLASSSLDWNVIVWDLGNGRGERARTLRFDAPVRSVQFCPTNSKMLVIVLESQQAILVKLRKRKKTLANGQANGAGPSHSHTTVVYEEERQELKLEFNDDEEKKSAFILSATFTPDGKRVALGTTKGDVLFFDCATGSLRHQAHAGSSGVRELSFDRSGRTLVTNSNDRVVRLFTVSIHTQEGLTEEASTIEMSPLHRFQDLVNRTPWLGIGFSADGEYVYGGASHKIAHNIYIWDRGAGVLDKILQGPRDSLIDVDWHPTRPMIASISHTGSVYLWYNPPTETWSAYAPGFEELEENIVYEEREDEFDLEDEEELTRRKQDEEEAFVEIRPPPARSKRDVPSKLRSNDDAMSIDKDGSDGDDDAEEEDDDGDDRDDCDEHFIIPVRLSLDLPSLGSET